MLYEVRSEVLRKCLLLDILLDILLDTLLDTLLEHPPRTPSSLESAPGQSRGTDVFVSASTSSHDRTPPSCHECSTGESFGFCTAVQHCSCMSGPRAQGNTATLGPRRRLSPAFLGPVNGAAAKGGTLPLVIQGTGQDRTVRTWGCHTLLRSPRSRGPLVTCQLHHLPIRPVRVPSPPSMPRPMERGPLFWNHHQILFPTSMFLLLYHCTTVPLYDCTTGTTGTTVLRPHMWA